MAEFGGAYVAGGAITGSGGPVGSVMIKESDTQISGSESLTYNNSNKTVTLLGHLSSSGNVSASVFFGDGSNLTNVDGTPGGSNTQLQFNNSGVFGASSNLTFASNVLTLTGSMNISGSLTVNQLNVNVTNKEVIQLSATGSTSFGDSADDNHTFVGSISGSKLNLSGLAAGTATTSSYLALDSNNNVVLTSSAGGAASGGTIGAA